MGVRACECSRACVLVFVCVWMRACVWVHVCASYGNVALVKRLLEYRPLLVRDGCPRPLLTILSVCVRVRARACV